MVVSDRFPYACRKRGVALSVAVTVPTSGRLPTSVHAMPRFLIKFIGFLLLVGSIGVVGVQGCTSSKAPRDLSTATGKTNG